MAAKSKLVGRFRVVVMLLALLVVCGEEGSGANAQAPDVGGKLFLDQKEANVLAIAGNATSNNNGCGGLNNCSSACSRVSCHPSVGSERTLICTRVDNNEHFDICPSYDCDDHMKLDYSQGFVTLPDPGYTNLQTEVATSICLQRTLDSTFKSVSFQSDYTLVYFGSVSGAFRSFPGREQNQTQCTTFDPRRRPWWVNGVSVHKDVKILVDVAGSMGSPVPVEYQQDSRTTYLNVTQNITRGLLQTFAPGDYVEVLSFDSQGATSLTGDPVLMSSTFDYLTPYRPELQPLLTLVNSLVASQAVAASNLTGAIAKAVASFTAANYSKVIIVLTNGEFAPMDAAFPTQRLLSTQTKLMIFKLPLDIFDTDPYLLTTSLQKAVCSVNGSFELLDPQATANPLYAMRSYFTFLSRTQLVAAENQPTWSYKYASVSQNLNAITVTYPAFGSDGKLIGMGGVDVIVDNLNTTLKGLVLTDFQNRRQGSLPVPAVIPMSCNYQTSDAPEYCPNSPTADNSAICQDGDNSIQLADITCCGDCGPGGGNGGGLSAGAKVGIALGVGVPAALVASLGVFCLCKRRRRREPPIDIRTGFKGDDDIPTGNAL